MPGGPGDRAVAAGTTCVGSTTPAGLTALFDLEPDGLAGADYQRAIQLPDGRVLWTFQDAQIRRPNGEVRLVHNAAMVQTGSCFQVLHGGTDDEPSSWLYTNDTVPFVRWFWPLDAVVSDGAVWVFMAEMVERGPLYLSITEPVATRVVALDQGTLQVLAGTLPANASASLYGFSITEDDSWTYLYAQCHRQFGYDLTIFGTLGHDFGCSADVRVGRVPRGRILDPPTYWDGTSWQADPARAVPVIAKGQRKINPTQVRWIGGEFLAVTKEGDWLGSTIYLDAAPTAHGPWTNYARIPAIPKCAPNECNTYFASWIPPFQPGGGLTIGLSHNRWDGRFSPVYRPTFLTVPPPGEFSLAMRCSLVDC